jgi:RHS repeat-associated protein
MQVVARRYYSPYGRLIDDLLQEQQTAFGGALDESYVLAGGQSDVGSAVWNEFDQSGEGEDLLSRFIAGDRLENLSGVRGFTSHETIEEIGLINMNARLYDPIIGRFVSADSIIPDLGTPLDYNRYSYVRGNPVVSRDPTGHEPISIALAVAFYAASHYGDNPSWQMASSVVLAATMMNPEFGIMGNIGKHSIGTAMVSSGVTNLTMSYLQTGKIGRKSLQNAAIAVASAGITHSIANGWIGGKLGLIGGELEWAKLTAAQMVSQGVIADLRGDKFIHGAVAALASKIGSYGTTGMSTFDSTIVAATLGGLAAQATGGDYLQGALSAATVHLFNFKGAKEPSLGLKTNVGKLFRGLFNIDGSASVGLESGNPELAMGATLKAGEVSGEIGSDGVFNGTMNGQSISQDLSGTLKGIGSSFSPVSFSMNITENGVIDWKIGLQLKAFQVEYYSGESSIEEWARGTKGFFGNAWKRADAINGLCKYMSGGCK